MRWPCGPLDIERGKRRDGFTPREADTLQQWTDPKALDLVAGTPVSCLVVTWAEGSEGDESQQRALAPLIAAARGRGLSVVGWVGTGADLKRAAGAAQASGLDAVATESSEPVPGGAVLRFRERSLADRSPSDFLGVASPVWPGASASLPTGADAASGPTGPPWLDSNAWYVRLVRTLVDPKVLWLAFDPPDLGQPVAAASYAPGDRRHRGLRGPLGGLAGPSPAPRPPGPASLGPGHLGRDRPQPRLLRETPCLGEPRPGRTARGGVRLRRGRRVPVVRGAEPARPPELPLPHPREEPSAGNALRRPGRRSLRGRHSSRGGSRPEALRVRRRRRDPDHAARMGGARGARGRLVALPVPRLPVRPRPARRGSRRARRPLPPGRGRAAPDEPPSRPGPALQRGHRSAALRHERRRPIRRPARARLPHALSPKRDDRVVPESLGQRQGLHGGDGGAGAGRTIRGRARRRVPPPAACRYTAPWRSPRDQSGHARGAGAVAKAVPGRFDRRRGPRRGTPRAVRQGGAFRDGVGGEVRHVRGGAPAHARSHVRPAGRPGEAGQGPDRRHQAQPHRPAHDTPRPPSRRSCPLGPSAGDRRRRAPHGSGGRPADPAARERLRERHPPRRVHVPGRVGRGRDRGRGPAGGAREHQLARRRAGVPPVRRAGRRPPLSLLPPQPLLPGL